MDNWKGIRKSLGKNEIGLRNYERWRDLSFHKYGLKLKYGLSWIWPIMHCNLYQNMVIGWT